MAKYKFKFLGSHPLTQERKLHPVGCTIKEVTVPELFGNPWYTSMFESEIELSLLYLVISSFNNNNSNNNNIIIIMITDTIFTCWNNNFTTQLLYAMLPSENIFLLIIQMM